MEKLISTKRYLSDPLARALLETFDDKENDLLLADSVFYYDFPSFRDYDDDSCRPNALLLSPNHGIVALNFCDSDIVRKNTGNLILSSDETLTQFYSILFGRLIKSRLLRKSRNELQFPFNALLYIPGLDNEQKTLSQKNVENIICNSFEALNEWLNIHRIPTIDGDVFSETRSIIEGAKALSRPKAREIPHGEKLPKAQMLASLEAEIANFDAEQRKAAITMLSGPERIRGLAGTGKTIVLAMKAAQLHLDNPDKIILYAFYTKSLYDLVKRLVTRFYRHYKDSDPNWEKLQILHAWGGANIEGVYHKACLDNGVSPLRWQDVSNRNEPFGFICADLLSKTTVKPAYDYILIDEGQDISENFFKLCFHLTPGDRDNKNIVWAYDELQNIFDVKVRSPRELL